MEFKWQEFQDYGAETDDEGEYENIDIAVPVIKSDEKIHLPKSESTDFDLLKVPTVSYSKVPFHISCNNDVYLIICPN